MLNYDDGKGVIKILGSCDLIDNCDNNQCFFKWRDKFKWCVWVQFDEQKQKDNSDLYNELELKFGPMIYPKITCSDMATNCYYIYCKNFKSKINE